jgi:hypothetical protein
VAGLKEKIEKTRLREEDDAGKQSRVGGSLLGVSLAQRLVEDCLFYRIVGKPCSTLLVG